MKYLIDFIVLALLYIFVLFRQWKAKGKDILLVNTLMYIYLAFVLFFTLMPVITSLPYILNHPYRFMNTVPFTDVLSGRGDFIRQVLLNIMLTVPFGFLFPLTRKPAVGFGKTIFSCFIMSLGIELLQPLIDGFRSADITDLITNTIGGVIGFGIYIIFKPILLWILQHLSKGQKLSRLKELSKMYALFAPIQAAYKESQSLKGLAKMRYDKEHKDSLSKYPELRERMQSLLQNGEKITPKQWKAEIQLLQAECNNIGREQSKTATELAYAEVISYNRKNLERELQNESRQRNRQQSRTKRREEEI